jgi:DNA-binding SARP family transcriptional activator
LGAALPDADRFLYTDHKILHWRPDAPFVLDVADSEQTERSDDQAGLQGALERATALYTGDLLPGCYDDWVLTERERLRQR